MVSKCGLLGLVFKSVLVSGAVKRVRLAGCVWLGSKSREEKPKATIQGQWIQRQMVLGSRAPRLSKAAWLPTSLSRLIQLCGGAWSRR